MNPFLRNLRDRLELSSLALIGILFFTLLAFRVFLWQDGPPSLILVLFIGCHILGTYILGPAAWNWHNAGHGRQILRSGLIPSLIWNLAWLALQTAVFMVAERLFVPAPNYPSRLIEIGRSLGLHPLLTVDLMAAPAIILVGWLIAEAYRMRRLQAEALERQRVLSDNLKAVEARALQAELDPHVLYNALGALAELVRRDPARAEQALLDFSNYYRRVTACARRQTITLAEERDLLELFLAIEQIRFGERLRVVWNWPEELDERHIPPLLLQPVVENAIKHGIAQAEEGGELKLEVREGQSGIHITVENSGAPLCGEVHPGHGLSNLLQRLDNLTPPGRFRLRSERGRTQAELLLPVLLEKHA